jgi:thiamine biosynthesis lipoprotein
MTVIQQNPVLQGETSHGLFKLSFNAIGSRCMIQFRTSEAETARSFRTAALDWIREFELTYSRFIASSELSRVNASAGGAAANISPDFEGMLDLCELVHSHSKGVIDPTSLPLTQLWDRAEKSQILPSSVDLERALQAVGWGKIERSAGKVRLPHPGMSLDFGGFGKEYAVDRLIQIAGDFRISDILVDLGRDIATRGRPPDFSHWVLGVEDAALHDQVLARAALSGQAMASSGNYRRYRMILGQRHGHQIDPRSGETAATEIDAVTCIASSCLVAGLFSQAAFIFGTREALGLIESQPGVEGLIQTQGHLHRTQKFHHYEI